jgi:hypothetical protein
VVERRRRNFADNPAKKRCADSGQVVSTNVAVRRERVRAIGAAPRPHAALSAPCCPYYIKPMAQLLSFYAVPLAIVAVTIVLLLGLVNMMRGGSPNLSQRLMRWRVLLQFIAIVIIMLTVWVMQRQAGP